VSELYPVHAFDGFEVSEAANGKPLFVPHTAVTHSTNILGQNFSGLRDHRLVARLHLLVDGQCSFDCSGYDRLLNASAIACVSGTANAVTCREFRRGLNI
jgi:hypothetical protein